MTDTPTEEIDLICQEILDNCKGHPHAKIAWPHRILHKAVALIRALAAERDAQKAEIARLREALFFYALAYGDRGNCARAALQHQPITEAENPPAKDLRNETKRLEGEG